MVVLKCEKPQLGDAISLLSGVMEGEGAKGKKAVDALTALSVMMKNRGIDSRQLQDLAAAASGLINSTSSDHNDNDVEHNSPL